MAFQLVDIQLAEPRSCVDLSQPVHMGVDQILIWCKETQISPLCDLYRYPHGTDVPMAQMSPFCDLHGSSWVSPSPGLHRCPHIGM